MRGEKEQACLNRVCEQFDIKNCYALSQVELESIRTYLNSAAPNPQKSIFPDFLFPGGFIEHFQISSSPEGRKGSKHIKEIAEFDRSFNENSDEFMDEMGNTHGEVKTYSNAYQYEGHSYESLESSFKKHWEDHLESLKKEPEFKNSVGIFMIHYSDRALDMMEDIFASSAEGLCLHIREAQKFRDYKLSRDKKLLRYIADYKAIIQYVIFINSEEVEIISLKNIDEILKLLPWDFCIASNFTIAHRSIYGISVPIGIEGDDNDQN